MNLLKSIFKIIRVAKAFQINQITSLSMTCSNKQKHVLAMDKTKTRPKKMINKTIATLDSKHRRKQVVNHPEHTIKSILLLQGNPNKISSYRTKVDLLAP